MRADTLRILKLDEWGGVPMTDPQSCEVYLQENLIKPLGIEEENYISFQSDSEVPADECKRIQEYLEEQGPIDLCIVGIGLNGHVALNEPADVLQPHCHVQELSEKSLSHPMAVGMEVKPTYGLTLGMVDILNSKQLILLISGANKAEITKEFMTKKITTSLPASLLWLHPNALCLCDQDALQSCRPGFRVKRSIRCLIHEVNDGFIAYSAVKAQSDFTGPACAESPDHIGCYLWFQCLQG